MTETELEIKTIEKTVKFIFNKETLLDDSEVLLATRLIAKWKKLTNWVEQGELPIVIN
jgi:hypothetical protein